MARLLSLLALLAGADALLLPTTRAPSRHAPIRMDGTQDRIEEMIKENK